MTFQPTQDERLSAPLSELLGPGHPVAAAALITPTTASVASRGAGLDADFEIASLSKGVTGLLYADALGRGEIRPETTLGDLLPLGDAPAAAVRLDALGTHRSGLPRLPAAAQPWRRTFALWRHGINPYGESLDELLEQARGVPVGKPVPRYSNLGFELLGHALASAAGTSYAELVQHRLAEPLGLDGCYVPATDDQLRPTALPGRSRSGRPRQPWTGEALGPAGGIRATILDLARLAGSLLEGSAPGLAALDPVAPFGAGARIGVAWLTITVKGRTIAQRWIRRVPVVARARPRGWDSGCHRVRHVRVRRPSRIRAAGRAHRRHDRMTTYPFRRDFGVPPERPVVPRRVMRRWAGAVGVGRGVVGFWWDRSRAAG